MIEFSHLSYWYPNQPEPVLRDVSLQIERGHFLLLIGASGSGKSTLLRCLNGLIPHFYGGRLRGRIRVEGRDPVALGPREMSDVVGFVTQNPEAHFVTRGVEDELAFALENHNFPEPFMRRRIEEVLEQLGLADLRERAVETLSGGEKQLVAIASVMTLQPQVLVLDEPTSQLDPQAAEQVLTLLQRLNVDLGLTIVLSEHRLERVVQYADQICYLPGRGQSPRIGPPRAILNEIEFAPPLVELGRALKWEPLPLTLKEARPFAEKLKSRLVNTCEAKPSLSSSDTLPSDKPPRESPPVVRVQDVWFGYDERPVLKGLSFSIQAGEWVALMGRNGVGKSTLLKLLVGLLKPARGAIHVLGMSVASTPLFEITRHVGLVPQNPGHLLFNETLEQELAFTRRAHALPPVPIEPVLARLGLAEHARAYPRDLSVGEQQRAALGAILIAEPKLLLLDEPTRGLDYMSKQRLLQILNALRAEGMTIVMATHDVELVAQSASRVLVLGNGTIIADGDTRTVMTDSLVFASQVNRLLRDARFLTVPQVLAQLGMDAAV